MCLLKRICFLCFLALSKATFECWTPCSTQPINPKLSWHKNLVTVNGSEISSSCVNCERLLHSNFHLFSMPQIEDFNATNCTSEFHELANLALLCLLIISINNFFLHNIHCNFKFHHQILDKTYDFLKVSFY